MQCYNCDKFGHFANECGSKESQEEAQFADGESETDEVVLMADLVDEDSEEVMWYLDTGCSNHMSGNRASFVNLDDTVKSSIRFGDNRMVKDEGIGSVRIRKNDGKLCTITDVLYVPSMKSNLISLGQLLEKEYSVKMENKELTLFNVKEKQVLKAPLNKHRTFKIGMSIVKSDCLNAVTESENWIWHERFGHLNFRDLKNQNAQGMVDGLPVIKMSTEMCEQCCESKQARSSYNT